MWKLTGDSCFDYIQMTLTLSSHNNVKIKDFVSKYIGQNNLKQCMKIVQWSYTFIQIKLLGHNEWNVHIMPCHSIERDASVMQDYIRITVHPASFHELLHSATSAWST